MTSRATFEGVLTAVRAPTAPAFIVRPSIWSESKYVVGDKDGVRVLDSACLHKKEKP